MVLFILLISLAGTVGLFFRIKKMKVSGWKRALFVFSMMFVALVTGLGVVFVLILTIPHEKVYEEYDSVDIVEGEDGYFLYPHDSGQRKYYEYLIADELGYEKIQRVDARNLIIKEECDCPQNFRFSKLKERMVYPGAVNFFLIPDFLVPVNKTKRAAYIPKNGIKPE